MAEGSGRWGAKLWHLPGTQLGVQSCPPSRQAPAPRLSPPPTHSQQLNLLFQTAREPPHIAESRSRLPGVRPGAPFYSHPSRRRALYPEALHYRTGSQLVPFRIWDRRYWLGRWLRAPFPPQLGRREGYLGTDRLQADSRVPDESHCFRETPLRTPAWAKFTGQGSPVLPNSCPRAATPLQPGAGATHRASLVGWRGRCPHGRGAGTGRSQPAGGQSRRSAAA